MSKPFLCLLMFLTAIVSADCHLGGPGDWGTGTFGFVRHLRSGRFELKWKIVPFRASHHPELKRLRKGKGPMWGVFWGSEDEHAATEFAWIRASLKGRSLVLPRSAYADCVNVPDFHFNDLWSVREEGKAVIVTAELGAHGGRIFAHWSFRHGKYAGRYYSVYSWGNAIRERAVGESTIEFRAYSYAEIYDTPSDPRRR